MRVTAAVELLKSKVEGYTTKTGKMVTAYERLANHFGWSHKPSSGKDGARTAGSVVHHPQMDEKGAPVEIDHPTPATPPENWGDSSKIATVPPGGATPKAINGLPFSPWVDAPTTKQGWANVTGQFDIDEPPFHLPQGKKAGAGVVVMEPDGRVWVVHPTNGFGGYKATFPKGTAEDGMSLQANAIKEAYEESGLKVEIVCHLGDWERTTSKARYYLARRTGGTPAAAGWESQAVSLVPAKQLYGVLNGAADHPVAEAVGAGSAPEQPKPQKVTAPQFGMSAKKDFGSPKKKGSFDDGDLEGYWDE